MRAWSEHFFEELAMEDHDLSIAWCTDNTIPCKSTFILIRKLRSPPSIFTSNRVVMESIGYTRTFIGQRRGSPTATNAAPRTSLTLQPRRGTRTPTAARRGTRPLTVAAISSHRRTPIAGQDQVHLPFASIPKVPIPPPSRDTILLVCLLVLLGANIASSRQIRNLPKKKLLDQLLIIGGFFGLVSGGLLFDIAVVSKMLLLMSVMVMMEKETHDD